MSKPISVPKTLANRALAGDADAQFELAELYMHSDYEDDIALAEEWAIKAAQQGHVEAMYWLGEGYTFYAKAVLEEDPEDAAKNFEQGFIFLKEAAAQQHPAATLELAGYYRRGTAVEQDVAQSIALVEKAAELGEVQAMHDLAFIYANGLGIDADEEKADYWTAKAQAAEQQD